MKINPSVNYKGNSLNLMGHDLALLAKKHGTPSYIYSFKRVQEKLKLLRNAFTAPLQIQYAMKSNSNRELLKKLHREKVGVDVVSGGEIQRALECGFKGQDIVFSGVAKSVGEIDLALKVDVHVFNVESPQELVRIAERARSFKKSKFTIWGKSPQTLKKARVSFRLNPDVNPKTHPYITTGFKENKFGMDVSFLPELIKILKANHDVLELVGLDFHIGSQLNEIKSFVEAAKKTVPTFLELRSQGFPLKYFDIGGGMGISYDGKPALDINKYGSTLEKILKPLGCNIVCEPGRFLVADSGVLLTQVEYVKKAPDKTFVIVNTGMHHLIRPALYQAHHEILPITKKPRAKNVLVDVVGPICESSDWLAKDRKMPLSEQGDVLAILDAGAYGYVMSSDYNLHPRPQEIVLD